MDPIISTEIIKSLGFIALPLVIVSGAMWQLFSVVKDQNRAFISAVEQFNITMQKNVLVIENFKEWRESSNRDHEKILNNQARILEKIK